MSRQTFGHYHGGDFMIMMMFGLHEAQALYESTCHDIDAHRDPRAVRNLKCGRCHWQCGGSM